MFGELNCELKDNGTYVHKSIGTYELNKPLTFGMTDGEILKEYIHNLKNTTIKSVYKGLNMSKTNLYQYFETQTFTKETKDKLEDYFGEKIFKEQPPNYLEQRRNHKLNHTKNEDITVYQIGTKASFIDIYEDEPDKPIGTLNSSVFPGCNHAERITGNSMYPMIVNQAMVVGEKLSDPRGISSGEIYVIHTNRGLRTCKYIHTIEKQPEAIRLVALSKQIPPQTIPLEDITLIMRVYFIINPS